MKLKFYNKEHEDFVIKKYSEHKDRVEIGDVYFMSLVYILGMSHSTRDHFSEIFDVKKQHIIPNSLNTGWQTCSSKKVTRMAFSLWNSWCYENEEDMENGIASFSYTPSQIFSCSYAPYFYEGIKIRYPSYTE